MKKLFLIITLQMALLPFTMQAQPPDTVFGRHYQYYYDNWYDECCSPETDARIWFYTSPIWNYIVPYDLVAKRFTVQGRVALKGLVAIPGGQQIKPEYLALFQYDTTAPGNTAFLDMVRWDTAARKVMKLPQCTTLNLDDSLKFLYLDAYEVYLQKPVVVDSVFYIAGTYNSDSTRYFPYNNDSTRVRCIYYQTIRSLFAPDCDTCLKYGNHYYNSFPVTGEWFQWGENVPDWGMFLAIIDSDYYQLTVRSDSVPMGTAEGSGHYVSMSQVQISATANPGYRFAMWNDGSTENPRTVEVYYDTVFTAIFTEESNLVVSVKASHPSRGTATGSGIYSPGQTATLQAFVTDSLYRFAGWSDGDTANPRMVVVDRDSLFTAIFAAPNGITDVHRSPLDFILSPNPSSDQVALTAPRDDNYNVSVFDNSGRLVTAAVFSGTMWTLDVRRLAAGTYYIRLRSAESEGTKSFVKQ